MTRVYIGRNQSGIDHSIVNKQMGLNFCSRATLILYLILLSFEL